jgi:hypothetical protein
VRPFEFTPSAGPRLQRCLGGSVLPNVDEDWESAQRGRALHGYMRALALGRTRREALVSVPEEWRADAERIAPVEDVASGRPEAGLALSLESGAALLLGEDMTREQVRGRKPPGSIGMLLDWLSAESETAVVRDWKTGWMEDLASASEHLQLRTYTAAALLALGKPYGRGELWHWDGVRWRVDAVTMDWLGAQEALEEVSELVAKARAAQVTHAERGELPRLAVGPWCTWCPAQRACPALTGGLVAVLKGEATPRPIAELTPEEAGRAYEMVRQLRARLDGLEADLKTLAGRTPLPLPGGKVLRLQEVERTSVDVEAAREWLTQRYGEAIPSAAETVRRSMSWESLGDALRENVLPGLLQAHAEKRLGGRKPSLAKLLEEARSGLEVVGAVKVSVHTQVRATAPESPDAQPPEPGAEG